MEIEFRLINKCLWCDKNEVSFHKLLCSVKCLEAMRKSANKQGVTCNYDKRDIYFPKTVKKER